MEDGVVNLARRLADELAGRDFRRSSPRKSSEYFKRCGDRRGDRCLPHMDRDAGSGEGFSFLASLADLRLEANIANKVRIEAAIISGGRYDQTTSQL